MNIRELSNFIRIVEIGSLSRAALVLNIAQPALGLQVRNLEAEFGQQLLVRHSRGVRPTDAGKILLAHARQIMQEIARARSAMSDAEGPSGMVNLGMTTSANNLLLAPLYKLCRTRFPNIRLGISENTSNRLTRMVLAGDIDLACVFNHGEVRGLSGELILSDEWVLVGASGQVPHTPTIRFSELGHLPLLLPSRSSGMRLRLDQEAAARDMELRIVLEVQSETLMKRLIDQNVGHTILPWLAVRDLGDASGLRVTRIVEPVFPSRTFIVWRDNPPPDAGVQAIRSLLLEISRTIGRSPLP